MIHPSKRLTIQERSQHWTLHLNTFGQIRLISEPFGWTVLTRKCDWSYGLHDIGRKLGDGSLFVGLHSNFETLIINMFNKFVGLAVTLLFDLKLCPTMTYILIYIYMAVFFYLFNYSLNYFSKANIIIAMFSG